MSAFADPILENQLRRLTNLHEKAQSELSRMLEGHPIAIRCDIHGTDRALSRELSQPARKPVYAPCATCQAERKEADTAERIRRAGVPENLCHATFENWIAESEVEEAHLASAREFTKVRRGFLLLIGELGTGKTHLAAAITRHFRNPLFTKQSEMLRRLRDFYRDKTARNPVDQAQDADLLVLDEIGLSGGGSDEFPMLHDVLDHRYNERKPTVLTGNVTLNQLQAVIGERMADRLRESAFAVLVFGGGSRRREARGKYFDQA